MNLMDDMLEHVDGIPWYEAPIPSRFHKCHAQTVGWIGFNQVLRCSCGAIRNPRFRGWLDKNSRRNERR